MLHVERLESRDVPATLADVLPHFDPVTYVRPMPDVPADRVLVAGADLDPADLAGGIVDVYAAHGGGNAARIVIRADGVPVADFFAYEETFRGGVESVAVIGTELFVAPGSSGGPRIVAVDLTTFAIRSFTVPGFAESWRGGLKLAVADVNHTNGFGSPDPESELLVLAGSAGAGPVVAFLNADGSRALSPFFVSDPNDRREWEFVPAGAGVMLPSANGGGVMGFLVQPAGQVIDATGHVAETSGFSWAGEPTESDHTFSIVV